MMFKVIIADDELLSRMGIKSLIDWESQGFSLVAECENGQKALEAIFQHKPDIVISDIKMPVFNGIELIRKAQEAGFTGKFILLSAYDDFEYIRQALKLGVEDYILKLELNSERLTDVLNRIGKKIADEKWHENSQFEKAEKLMKSINHLIELFLSECFMGIMTDENKIESSLSEFNFLGTDRNLLCMLVRIDSKQDRNMAGDLLKDPTIIDTVQAVANEFGNSFTMRHKGSLILLTALIAADKDCISKFVLRIQDLMSNVYHANTRIYPSEIFNSYGSIWKIFRSLEQEADESHSNENVIPFNVYLTQFEDALSNLDLPMASSSLNEIARIFTEYDQKHFYNLSSTCHIIGFLINGFISQNNINPEAFFRHGNPFRQIDKCRTIDDFIHWLDQIKTGFEKIQNEFNSGSFLMIRVKRYINNNLDKELTLNDIARSVNLSSNYLCRLFRQVTKQPLFSYINSCRIDRAKYLLINTSLMIYEIANLTGFENSHYFSRTFKRFAGMSPQDFKRKNCTNNQDNALK